MLEQLKEQVLKANLELVKRGLVLYTWGNVSGIDRENGFVVIKPSGVEYDNMTAEDMTVVDLMTGRVVEGAYKPSSDTPTHLELYRRFPSIGGVSHTHSAHAVAFAQAGRDIPALGTTHADYFYGNIPCTRNLEREEVEESYERNTGKIIAEEFEKRCLNPLEVPGVIVRSHGPFTFGKDADDAVFHAVVLEQVSGMAFETLLLNPDSHMREYILDKHYNRKHGAGAYYGQDKK